METDPRLVSSLMAMVFPLEQKTLQKVWSLGRGRVGRADPRNPVFWEPSENSLSGPPPHSQLSKAWSTTVAPRWGWVLALVAQVLGERFEPVSFVCHFVQTETPLFPINYF